VSLLSIELDELTSYEFRFAFALLEIENLKLLGDTLSCKKYCSSFEDLNESKL